MRVDIWDQESVQDYLQLDHRDNDDDEGAAVEIVAILGEERQRRKR